MVVRMRTTSLLSQTFLLSDVKHTRLKFILSSSYIFAHEYTQLLVCFYSILILQKFHKEANLICPIFHISRGRTQGGYYRAATVDAENRAKSRDIWKHMAAYSVYNLCDK